MHVNKRRRFLVLIGTLLFIVLLLKPRLGHPGKSLTERSFVNDEASTQNQLGKAYQDISWGALDNYQIVNKIGEGEYSEVFVSIDRRNDRACVVKILKPPVDMEVVKHEIDVLQDLRGGPNVLELIDAAIDANSTAVALVTEYVNNTSWKKLYPRLSNLEVRYYAFQLLRALDHAHAINIMHRDLKPDNVVINHESQKLRLIDWGTSEYYQTGHSYETHVTTRWWRAPEIVVQNPFYGVAADMWAFGCMLAALVFRIEPFFPGADSVDQLVQIASVLGTLDLFNWLDSSQIAMPQAFENVTDWYPKSEWHTFVNEQNHDRVDRHAIDLVDRILVYDPEKRITAKDALDHPYFDTIRRDAMKYPSSFGAHKG